MNDVDYSYKIMLAYLSMYYTALGLDYNIPIDTYKTKYKMSETDAVALAFLSIKSLILL